MLVLVSAGTAQTGCLIPVAPGWGRTHLAHTAPVSAGIKDCSFAAAASLGSVGLPGRLGLAGIPGVADLVVRSCWGSFYLFFDISGAISLVSYSFFSFALLYFSAIIVVLVVVLAVRIRSALLRVHFLRARAL